MSFMKKNFLLYIFMLLFAPAAYGAETIFQLVVPLSGPLAQLGEGAQNGAELAIKTWAGDYELIVVDENEPNSVKVSPDKLALSIGYLTESRFTNDAPTYIQAKKPVLLPFLTNSEAATRSSTYFFRLMPSFEEQGEFMALDILNKKKRPEDILIIIGATPQQAALVQNFQRTLAEPPPPPPEPKKKAPKALKPFSGNMVVLELIEAMDAARLAEATANRPDQIILALDIPEALKLAPLLAEAKLTRVPMLGGAVLAFRILGAAYASLDLNLSLLLPVADLSDDRNQAVANFKRTYLTEYQAQPTWIAALAFDALKLAINAASLSTTGDATILESLSGEFHNLGAYQISPGSGGAIPQGIMPVHESTLGFLP